MVSISHRLHKIYSHKLYKILDSGELKDTVIFNPHETQYSITGYVFTTSLKIRLLHPKCPLGTVTGPSWLLGTTAESKYKHQSNAKTLQQKIDFWHTEIFPSIVSFTNTAVAHMGNDKSKFILPEINLVVHVPQNYHL